MVPKRQRISVPKQEEDIVEKMREGEIVTECESPVPRPRPSCAMC